MTSHLIDVLHLLGTAVWIGGMIFIHLILQPALKHIDLQQGGKLMGIIAPRFSMVAWSSMLLLLITGYLKTPDGMLFDTTSGVGQLLFVKHLLIALVIVIGLVIAFVVVPGMKKSLPKPGERPPEELEKYQKRLRSLSTLNLLLGLAILVIAAFL